MAGPSPEEVQRLEWIDNPARRKGIRWTYVYPFLGGSALLSFALWFLLTTAGPINSVLIGIVGLFFVLEIALVLVPIAREPHAVAITEEGLYLKLGLFAPRRQSLIRWTSVRKFTMQFAITTPSLIAHYGKKSEKSIGFMSRELMRAITEAHEAATRDSEGEPSEPD